MSVTLPCPSCSSMRSKVTDSRASSEPVENVRRRRRCLDCGEKWTTREMLEDVDFRSFVYLGRLSDAARAIVRTIVRSLEAL